MKKYLLLSLCLLTISSIYAQKIQLVKDINTSAKNASSDPIVAGTFSDGRVILFADDGKESNALYISDGTASGTQKIKGTGDHINSTFPTLFVNNKLFFLAQDAIHGKELWVSDGTTAGTHMVKDINPGTAHGVPLFVSFAYLNGKVFFVANDPASGFELWSSDGTEAGTKIVKDVYAGPGWSNPGSLFTGLGKVYFTAINGLYSNSGFWVTDGTEAGTYQLAGAYPYLGIARDTKFVEYNNKLYFTAIESNSIGYELYSTDGQTVSLVKNINRTINNSSEIEELMVAGNKFFFRATSDEVHNEIWCSDGTTAGTKMVKDLNSIPNVSTGPYLLGEVYGKLIFSAADGGVYGRELYITDGTESGTKIVKDVAAGADYGFEVTYSEGKYKGGETSGDGYIYDNILYYSGYTKETGKELWRSDGTEAGTYIVDEVGLKPNSSASSNLKYIYLSGSILWLNMTDGENGNELYRCQLPLSIIAENTSVINQLTVSPNPARDNIQVRLGSNSFNNGYLKLTDITGRVVYDQSIAPNAKHISIPLSNQPTGVYIVTVNLDNRISSEKLVVE